MSTLKYVRLEHSGEIILHPHESSKCEGQPCTIHNRSDHHMRHLPQHWRYDRRIMERICEHGCGHPDPDQRLEKYEGVHGCCEQGCCVGGGRRARGTIVGTCRYCRAEITSDRVPGDAPPTDSAGLLTCDDCYVVTQ